jgi:sec-independent protein translocase protein TatB
LERGWADDNPLLSAPEAQDLQTPAPQYRHPKKNWRLKRGVVPQWYKRRLGIRTTAQSGAARVARYRPRSLPR